MVAFEVPSSTRFLQVTCAIVWCLLAAGTVFGFAAIKPILINEGVYKDKCNVSTKPLISGSGGYEIPCVDQDLSLNMLFTVACMVTNVSALPVGSILDTYGPKVTGIIGSVIIALGATAMLFAPKLLFVDLYLTGYTLLALGGPFVFISCFQLANSFPKNSGLVLALLTGSFDSSSALFLLYRVIYFNYAPVSISKFFLVYMVVPVFIFVCQITIMPTHSYKTVGTLAKIASTAIDESGRPLDEDLLRPEHRNSVAEAHDIEQPNMAETTSLLMRRASFGTHRPDSRRASTTLKASRRSSTHSVYEQDAEDKLIESTGGVFGVLHGYSVIDQLKSPWCILTTLFTTIQMIRINYFVATVKSQELYLYGGNEEIALQINHFFDVALPLGGVVAVPFIGLVLDNLTTLKTLIFLSFISVAVGIFGLMSWLPGTYAGIILLVVYRPFYYTTISDFCAKVFGFETFGTVYGTIMSFAGLCNIIQQFLDRITHVYFGMNPGPVNSILTGSTVVVAFAMILYVRLQELKMKRRSLQLEAESAVVGHIPE